MDPEKQEADVAADLGVDGVLLLVADDMTEPAHKIWKQCSVTVGTL